LYKPDYRFQVRYQNVIQIEYRVHSCHISLTSKVSVVCAKLTTVNCDITFLNFKSHGYLSRLKNRTFTMYNLSSKKPNNMRNIKDICSMFNHATPQTQNFKHIAIWFIITGNIIGYPRYTSLLSLGWYCWPFRN